MQFFDLVVIGGGIAGISAAIQAKEAGVDSVIILEREQGLGGNLNQCIHSGFGLEVFNNNLTGTEFCQRLIDKALELNIKYEINTTVMEINKDKSLTAVNSDQGVFQINCRALIFATGAIESKRSALNIVGSKLAGIYTAGATQRMINVEGYLPGKEVVVIGTENLGLIMARRMVIEGARVKVVIEKSHSPKGSMKNIEECLEDFNIPLLLNHDVIKINGNARVEELTIIKTDDEGLPVQGTEKTVSCDTVLLSVELVPKVELLKDAGIKVSEDGMFTDGEGIFVCGDANYIHHTADSIVFEGREAGIHAFNYISDIVEF